jgi:AcrR family transcriptional regulator
VSDKEIADQNGRVLGPRALETRRRLLEATEKLLGVTKHRDLRVIDIARQVRTSAATFYQYFRDVDDVVLCVAQQVSQEIPGMLELISGSWVGDEGRTKARSIVEAFIEHWDAHQAVLRVRNLASDEGDERFQRVRAKMMTPVLMQLTQVIEEHRGNDDAPGHPAAAAAAMAAILERLAAYHRELEVLGVSREDLVDSSAHILHRTVTGR